MASKSQSIGQRMGLVLGPVLLIALVGSGLGWRALLHVGERTQEVVSDSVATERLVSEWQRHTGINVARALGLLGETTQPSERPRIFRILLSLGWTRKQKMSDGRRAWYWVHERA